MNKEYILEVKNLEYTYGDGTHALKGINLKIEKGKKIAIIGVNGSGKSTLFLNMNGVLNLYLLIILVQYSSLMK